MCVSCGSEIRDAYIPEILFVQRHLLLRVYDIKYLLGNSTLLFFI
jgi:hypothetical protein